MAWSLAISLPIPSVVLSIMLRSHTVWCV